MAIVDIEQHGTDGWFFAKNAASQDLFLFASTRDEINDEALHALALLNKLNARDTERATRIRSGWHQTGSERLQAVG